MSLHWHCDRCGKAKEAEDVDDPPEDWRWIEAPIRGSEGARSTLRRALCAQCDDELYEWWNRL